MKIYLIRHGETDWNHINRFQGREDIELNAAGIAQAVRCGQTLQGLGIEAVYTSPLNRLLLLTLIVLLSSFVLWNNIFFIVLMLDSTCFLRCRQTFFYHFDIFMLE